MSNSDLKYYLKLQRLKIIFYPFLVLLDRMRILPFFIPVINLIFRIVGIKKQYQKNLNYRLIAESSKNYFLEKNVSLNKLMLVPFFRGGDNIFLLWSFAIAKKMEEQGYKTKFIICDKILPICSNQRIHKTSNDDKFLCSNCYNGYDYIAKLSKAEFILLSHHVDEKELNEEYLKVDKLNSIEECKSYEYEDYKIGESNYSSVLRFFQTGEMKNTVEYINNYKQFLKAGILFVRGWHKMLDENKLNPDILLIFNGVLSIDSIVVEYCKKQSIKYVTHECFYGENSWMYKVNGDIMTLFWEKEWKEFARNKLTQEQKNTAIEFMTGFKNGEKHYIRFNHDYPMNHDLKRDEYVVLFTNLNFDTAVLGRNPVFESMYSWIEEIIDFWKRNDIQIKLVIRVHPAEAKVLTVAEDRASKKILPLIANCPNIILFDAEAKVDSYKLIQDMKFSLVYASTIGLEIAIMNKIALVAGNAHYRKQKFALFHDNKEDYFSELKSLLSKTDLINHYSEEAIQYSYFLFSIRIKQINGLKTDHLNKVNEFNFTDLGELISKNEVLLNEFIEEINSY